MSLWAPAGALPRLACAGCWEGAEVGLSSDEALRAHVTLRSLLLCIWLPEQSTGLEPGCCPAWTLGAGGEAGEGFPSVWWWFLNRGVRGAPIGRQLSQYFSRQEGSLWGQLLLLGRPEGVLHQVAWSSRRTCCCLPRLLLRTPQGHHCQHRRSWWEGEGDCSITGGSHRPR